MKLDLQLVDTHNLYSFAIADLSNYGNAVISNASMEITAPGYNKTNVIFVPRTVNIYNSDTLNIVCPDESPLPDGIYKLKYSVAPNGTNWVEKTFMRVDAIKANYARVFLSVDISCDCNTSYKGVLKNKLRDIKLLIEGSVAAANSCDEEGAYQMYKKANSLLSDIKACDC